MAARGARSPGRQPLRGTVPRPHSAFPGAPSPPCMHSTWPACMSRRTCRLCTWHHRIMPLTCLIHHADSSPLPRSPESRMSRDPCCMVLRGPLYQRGAAIEIDERRKSGTCCRETGKPSPYSPSSHVCVPW